MVDGGVHLLKYRPEVAPWQFRSHRLRRLHRKLVPRRRPYRVRRRHQHHRRHEHAGPQAAARRFRGAASRARCSCRSCRRCSASGRSSRSCSSSSSRRAAVSRQSPKGRSGSARRPRSSSIRDNLRYRRDIERAYLAAIRTAQREILIANAYFFPGIRFRRALIAAARRGVAGDAAAAGAGRVQAAALRVARAVRPAAGRGRRDPGIPPLVPAREGRGDRRPLGDGGVVEHRSVSRS